ncbi:hypothetical protein HID58_093467, partial [Brassica napus]
MSLTLLSSGGRCLEPVPEALLLFLLISALPSYVLYFGHALDSGEGISRRPPAPLESIAEPVTRSFPGDTTRWFDGVGVWSRLLGFRVQIYFPSQVWSLTKASGGVMLLCLFQGLCASVFSLDPLMGSGFLVAVEKSDDGVDVAVVLWRLGSADVYSLRLRVHWRFFYSVAHAGLCVAVWWRVVSGSGVWSQTHKITVYISNLIALLLFLLVSALPSYVLYLGYALDYGEGISRRPPAPLERIAEPVTRSFPGATTRWFDGVGVWSRLLGFRAQIYFTFQVWSLTEASGDVMLLCLFQGLCASVFSLDPIMGS